MLKELGLRVLVALQNLSGKMQDEEGQTLAEYGLIMAVIAVAVVVGAAFAFKNAIVNAFTDATDCLNSASGGTC
ncbi:MAG: Flp family type IVb pilin [Dehalococcoidia bacterium]